MDFGVFLILLAMALALGAIAYYIGSYDGYNEFEAELNKLHVDYQISYRNGYDDGFRDANSGLKTQVDPEKIQKVVESLNSGEIRDCPQITYPQQEPYPAEVIKNLDEAAKGPVKPEPKRRFKEDEIIDSVVKDLTSPDTKLDMALDAPIREKKRQPAKTRIHPKLKAKEKRR